MEKQDYSFKGTLNGVEYDDLMEFAKAFNEASISGSIDNVSYHYKSLTENIPEDKPSEKTDMDRKQCKSGNGSDDTVGRVIQIKEIIQQVANLSDEISESDKFTDDRLDTVNDILSSSIEKIKYLISGMRTEDREEFCGKLYDGMLRLFDEADSESKDLAYEEAKYRQELVEDNRDIELEIKRLKEEYNSNSEEINHSYNRCNASENLTFFFSNLIDILKIR